MFALKNLGTGWWKKVFSSTLNCLNVSLASCLIGDSCFLPFPSTPQTLDTKQSALCSHLGLLSIHPFHNIQALLCPKTVKKWQGWTYGGQDVLPKGFWLLWSILKKNPTTKPQQSSYILVGHSHPLHKHWKLHENYYYCFQLRMQFPEWISFHWGWKYKLWYAEHTKKTVLVNMT